MNTAAVGATQVTNQYTQKSWTLTTGIYTNDLTQWRISWAFAGTGTYVIGQWWYTSETKYLSAGVLQSSGTVNWIAMGE